MEKFTWKYGNPKEMFTKDFLLKERRASFFLRKKLTWHQKKRLTCMTGLTEGNINLGKLPTCRKCSTEANASMMEMMTWNTAGNAHMKEMALRMCMLNWNVNLNAMMEWRSWSKGNVNLLKGLRIANPKDCLFKEMYVLKYSKCEFEMNANLNKMLAWKKC
jgi:hypothetical protein